MEHIKNLIIIIILNIAITYLASASKKLNQNSQRTISLEKTGWTMSSLGILEDWSTSRKFFVGDKLVFKHPDTIYNVLEVNGSEFINCKAITPTEVKYELGEPEDEWGYARGQSIVELTQPGPKYFMCGKRRHCKYGLKLSIIVLPAEPERTTSPPPVLGITVFVIVILSILLLRKPPSHSPPPQLYKPQFRKQKL